MQEPHFNAARLDLTGVVSTLVAEGLAQDEAVRAVEMYRQFLATAIAYPTATLVPTKLVDRAWHAHLGLNYEADCLALCGAVLVHQPNVFGTPEWFEAYDLTRKLVPYGSLMATDPMSGTAEAGAECFRMPSPMAGAECFLARRAA